MTLAEDLAEKYWSEFCDNPELSAKEQVAAAVNEAIERCAQEAEREPRVWGANAPDPQHRIAARIRALGAGKSKAQS